MPSVIRNLNLRSESRVGNLLALVAGLAGVCSWLIYWFSE
ncbi:hypothetical protein SAMN05216567_109399 [Variovorax sp. OK605]|jgi:hypothetical protein|nr:hypothetical protein SAMN05518853_119109 [Variovorax sp. OK202]SFE23448.1 hypothetical protein SAMN05444746_119109 [Variovorax sp. OK212]SFP90277.1 hypothetical protein SAMN05216567_109399 [Variovorax sp. OK605]